MGLIAWLLDGIILYSLFVTIPLLGIGCLLYYLLCVGVAVNSRPSTHKGMRERLSRLKAEQKENDRKYHQIEVDKAKDKWNTWANEEGVLSPLKVIIIFLLLFLIGWGLRHV